MIPSFWGSLGKKRKGDDNQALYTQPNIKYEIQPLSHLTMFTYSVLFYIIGKKIKHSQKNINFPLSLKYTFID